MTGFFDNNPTGGGAAGASVGGAVGSGVLAGVKQMKNDAEKLIGIANSGGFRADPEGVRELTQVCDDMLRELGEHGETFRMIAQEPKLGTGPYAQQVAQHVRLSADGPQGAVPQIDELRNILMTLKEVFFRASGQYAEADEAARIRSDQS